MGNEDTKGKGTGTSKLFCNISDLSAIGYVMSLGRYIEVFTRARVRVFKGKDDVLNP